MAGASPQGWGGMRAGAEGRAQALGRSRRAGGRLPRKERAGRPPAVDRLAVAGVPPDQGVFLLRRRCRPSGLQL